MWQKAFVNDDEFDQLTATVFSRFEWEQGEQFLEDGQLSPTANPWMRAVLADIEALRKFDTVAHIPGRVAGQLQKLLLDRELAQDFAEVDVSILRAAAFTTAIPPPGYIRRQGGLPDRQEEAELFFLCSEMCADDTRCEKVFESYKALRTHMVQSQGGTHGKQSIARLATPTNQCAVCQKIFASGEMAKRDITRSAAGGSCRGSGSCFRMDVAPYPPECLVCDLPLPTGAQARMHTLLHLPQEFVQGAADLPEVDLGEDDLQFG